MNPNALYKLTVLLRELIRSRCRSKAECDRLTEMLREFFEEASKDANVRPGT